METNDAQVDRAKWSAGEAMMDRYLELADKEPFADLERLYFEFENAAWWTEEQRQAQYALQTAILEAAKLFPDRAVFEDCLGDCFPAVDAFDPGQEWTFRKGARSLHTTPPYDYGAEQVRNPDGSLTLKAVTEITMSDD
jgi:hypothetical protein